MAAKKGNKYGKQFSKDYQPPEKWTEEKALEVGYKLLSWQKKEEENIFYDEFLYINNDYYPQLITYLKEKYKSFLKLYEKSKKIQETKLKHFGCFDKLNASMTKFTLINNHDWKEKSETNNKHSGEIKTVNLTDKQIEQINKKLEDEF